MSAYLYRESYRYRQSAAAFAPQRRASWRALFGRAAETVRTWIRRRQQRRELLDYMAIDHRAENDMGIIGNDAREWASRPFWQP